MSMTKTVSSKSVEQRLAAAQRPEALQKRP
jgi:hypothetical protein